MFDLIVRNTAFLTSSQLQDIGVKNNQIKEIGKINTKGRKEIDAEGNLALPPFVESHIHYDTVLTAGDPHWNESGTLIEGINVWSKRKKKLTVDDVQTRAFHVIKEQIKYGVLHVRSHVDISDPNLTALHALLELKEQVAPFINIQLVAFPQDGILSCPGNEQRLEEALKLGVDAIGAIPHCEHTREDGIKSLEICFSLARKYKRMVNVFCDETDDSQSKFLEVVASLALKTGLKQKVSASHANAMAYYSEPYAAHLFGILQKSEINIISCPLVSSVMQGRFDQWPKGRGLTRIKELTEAGINVSLGHDDIRTPFYPIGTGNMLQAAHTAVHLAHMSGRNDMEELIHMITMRGAKSLQIEDIYGIEIGKPANFVILPVDDAYDLIRHQPDCRYVISHGKVIAETEPARTKLSENIIL